MQYHEYYTLCLYSCSHRSYICCTIMAQKLCIVLKKYCAGLKKFYCQLSIVLWAAGSQLPHNHSLNLLLHNGCEFTSCIHGLRMLLLHLISLFAYWNAHYIADHAHTGRWSILQPLSSSLPSPWDLYCFPLHRDSSPAVSIRECVCAHTVQLVFADHTHADTCRWGLLQHQLDM